LLRCQIKTSNDPPREAHTFISHALAGGRTLAEVRDAAGHSNVSITSGYLHVAVDDESVGALFV
jgi:site-specific recombinase XerD